MKRLKHKFSYGKTIPSAIMKKDSELVNLDTSRTAITLFP